MRILIAEDEKDIRDMYYTALVERGHHVIVTSDGEESLQAYSRHWQHQKHQEELRHEESKTSSLCFDVVLLDYKMPRKDGLEVAKEIFKINPEQRIIFASAYVIETLVESVKQLKRVVELIQKPFRISELVDVVENRDAYEDLKTLMTAARDINNNFDNLSSDQIRRLIEALRRLQKFRGF